MEINGITLLEDEETILVELRRQLAINGVVRFNKIINSGDNIMTNCPFHKDGQERKPSFGIHKKDGTCHCFGCGWVGSFAEMISNCFGKDDLGKFGTRWLSTNFVSVSVENRPDIDVDFTRRKKITGVEKQFVSEEELDSYRYTHPYMYERKLTDEIIDLFDIGYDRNTRCITFPVRDIEGNTLFIARRSVDTKFFNYPMNTEKPVYGLYELEKINAWEKYRTVKLDGRARGLDELIICESMIDALTCWVYGKPAVALNGLGNDLQFKQLNNMHCRKFILATDMDEAGLRARKRIKEALKNKIVTEYYWDINYAKDINDMDYDYFTHSLTEVM